MTNPLKTQIGGSHYKNFEYQPIEFFMDMKLNFIQCNIIKYIVRHRSKNGIEDVKKARHYAEIGMSIDKSNNLCLDDNVLRFANQVDGYLEQNIIGLAVSSEYYMIIKLCRELINDYDNE